VWNLGFFPIRGYALAIIVGIFAAIIIGNRRYVARGGQAGVIADMAIWAVPFGIVGGRIYHVLTSWGTYFGPGGDPSRAIKVWEGGLGIWGAVLFGSVGVWIGARRKGLLLPPIADALAPGLAVAQAIGRWGNWFNQELFGRPTTLPWGLQIDAEFRPNGYTDFATFHPTFLYECLWCLAAAAVVVWADRRFRLGHGRVFALYIAMYCLGRGAIESLRIDASPELLGLRWNEWVAMFVGIAALLYVVLVGRLKPGREESMNRREAEGEFAHE
jgi:prolipoprotein diacylglyceryl transferase